MTAQDSIPVQENKLIQAVQGRDGHIQEGYQPLGEVRKSYQPTDTPPPQSPPQSVSGIFTYGEALAAPPLPSPAPASAPASSAQAQSTDAGSTQTA
jgi:hypothetical protein